MRSISRSACFISSIDSFFSDSSSFFKPQLLNMRAWRKYWLMAVSSLNSTLFRCCTTLASPFIAASAGSAMLERSGRRGQRLGRLNVTQQVARAVAAAPATRADTELEGKLVQRAGTVSRAVAHGFL